MRNIIPVATAAVLFICSGCQTQTQHHGTDKTADETKMLPPLHLGAVHQVYPQQGFVLLRIIGPMPAPGTVLITHPADGSTSRVANLTVTADQPSRNRMIIAEIRSGHVAQGDRVFMYRNIAQPEESEEEEEIAEELVPPVSQPVRTEQTPESILQNLNDVPASVTEIEENASTGKESKKKSHKETKTPDHIFDIPDNIDDWD